jgi:hypothetical protein
LAIDCRDVSRELLGAPSKRELIEIALGFAHRAVVLEEKVIDLSAELEKRKVAAVSMTANQPTSKTPAAPKTAHLVLVRH